MSDPLAPADDTSVPDLVELSRIEQELTDVERALQRLDEGSYGTCEVCNAALPDDVLADEPALRRCQEHAA
ncbi:MAG: hypothetical protein M3Z03_17690 [Actinomycetota bacterium]|nr:hypothetical protein [Actinomycetota bacterium]